MASPMPVANPLLRPTQNPLTRWAPGAPAMPQRQLPLGALRMPPPAPAPNALMAPQAAPPIPLPPQRSNEGIEDRVSTRIPTSARLNFDPHMRSDLSANYHAMLPEGLPSDHFPPEHYGAARAKVGEALANHANTIREKYPFIDTTGLSDAGTLERFVEHAHDNIVGLWNAVKDKPWRDQAAEWYRGANRLAKNLGNKYGVSDRQAAAVIATLSPQKDWDQNVSLAERVLDTHRNHQDTKVTPQMRDFMQKMVDARKPSVRGALDIFVNGGRSAKTGEEFQPITVGQTYRDLQHPKQKALFIRARDEMHSPDRGYAIISPGGERTRAKTPKGGVDATAAWGGTDEIANAVKALSADHLPTISRALGARHKVRNFYNNIIAPDAAAFTRPEHGDVTADTHAINVGLMFPMGSSHPMVAEGLGNNGPNATGAQGLYGLHADAYRRAARTISQSENRQYLPREVQSVVWEAVRNLWRKEHKALDQNGRPAHPVGQVAEGAAYAARHGFMPKDMARSAVIQAAGGIRDPNWHTKNAMVEEE